MTIIPPHKIANTSTNQNAITQNDLTDIPQGAMKHFLNIGPGGAKVFFNHNLNGYLMDAAGSTCNELIFNQPGQAASLVFIDNKWRLVNTGCNISVNTTTDSVDGTTTVIKSGDNPWLHNATNALNIYYIQGNVGIGKSDPSYPLDVTGDIVNSLGEGGIWVCNINGSINNGDLICSSQISGIGMKQDSTLFHNYTVAKSTINCDFNPQLQNIKKIKTNTVEKTIEKDVVKNNTYYTYEFDGTNYVQIETQREVLVEEEILIVNSEGVPVLDDEGNQLFKARTKKETQIITEEEPVLDNNGNFIWEDSTETEYPYEMKYVRLDGTIIDKSTYEQEKNADSNAQVYKIAFIGCTYHCG